MNVGEANGARTRVKLLLRGLENLKIRIQYEPPIIPLNL